MEMGASRLDEGFKKPSLGRDGVQGEAIPLCFSFFPLSGTPYFSYFQLLPFS